MKALLLCCLLSSVSGLAFAAGGKVPPPNDHSGRPQCGYYDSGSKEEHRPHVSQGECLSVHGNCELLCFSYFQKCKVEGLRIETVRENNILVDKEIKTTYEGSHPDYRRALEIATRRCETE